MMTLPPKFLKGSYPPLITPFSENGDIDYAAYERLIEFQIREGSQTTRCGRIPRVGRHRDTQY
jgi:dihydrodipicolinate synthase/N-acetylneuraminate lyase